MYLFKRFYNLTIKKLITLTPQKVLFGLQSCLYAVYTSNMCNLIKQNDVQTFCIVNLCTYSFPSLRHFPSNLCVCCVLRISKLAHRLNNSLSSTNFTKLRHLDLKKQSAHIYSIVSYKRFYSKAFTPYIFHYDYVHKRKSYG